MSVASSRNLIGVIHRDFSDMHVKPHTLSETIEYDQPIPNYPYVIPQKNPLTPYFPSPLCETTQPNFHWPS